MKALIQKLWTRRGANGERGAALTEYGILLALIAAVVIGIIGTLGTRIQQVFQDIVNNLN
ncbi:MAG TPA: Flp family type IVb pilin [Candidatus Udaeobacter sp.]|nr:Flp family type IVb pilin [Candidatus Udaeobacter sp.]